MYFVSIHINGEENHREIAEFFDNYEEAKTKALEIKSLMEDVVSFVEQVERVKVTDGKLEYDACYTLDMF